MTKVLNKTILYDRHLLAQGRMGPVFDFELPYEYGKGRESEYWAVRKAAAVADGDFMRRLAVRGPGALERLQSIVAGDIGNMSTGWMSYALICRPDGEMLDSVTIIRLAADEYLVIADQPEVEDHLRKMSVGGDVDIKDVSSQSLMLTIQGSRSAEIAQALTGPVSGNLKARQVAAFDFKGRQGLISRFGFTGEGGFELLVEPAEAPWFWDQSLNCGAAPCGYLAAEDLRIGAGYVSLDKESDNPFENKLGGMVNFGKGDFIGRKALQNILKSGLEKVLIWLFLHETADLPLEMAAIEVGGDRVGQISSSGVFWPEGRSLAMGYVKPQWAVEGLNCSLNTGGGSGYEARLLCRPPLK